MKRCILFWIGLFLATMIAPATSFGHKIISFRPYMGPVVTYYNATPYKAQASSLQAYINKSNVGITLKPAASQAQANIVISTKAKLSCEGGASGFGGTSSTGQGFVHMPRKCASQEAMLVMAHEMGHALGLQHENRRCAVMNDHYLQATKTTVRPYRCPKVRNWITTPYFADDLAGLKARHTNHPPVTNFTIPSATSPVDSWVTLAENTSDEDYNLTLQTVDWGDGSPIQRYVPPRFSSWPGWMGSHLYVVPGSYTITVTATDSYGKTATASRQINALAPPSIPIPDLPLPNGTLPIPDVIWVD